VRKGLFVLPRLLYKKGFLCVAITAFAQPLEAKRQLSVRAPVSLQAVTPANHCSRGDATVSTSSERPTQMRQEELSEEHKGVNGMASVQTASCRSSSAMRCSSLERYKMRSTSPRRPTSSLQAVIGQNTNSSRTSLKKQLSKMPGFRISFCSVTASVCRSHHMFWSTSPLNPHSF
jgi:hypothetical protein